jgi:hypothetical protein
VIESFFATVKKEEAERFPSYSDAKMALFDYIEDSVTSPADTQRSARSVRRPPGQSVIITSGPSAATGPGILRWTTESIWNTPETPVGWGARRHSQDRRLIFRGLEPT